MSPANALHITMLVLDFMCASCAMLLSQYSSFCLHCHHCNLKLCDKTCLCFPPHAQHRTMTVENVTLDRFIPVGVNEPCLAYVIIASCSSYNMQGFHRDLYQLIIMEHHGMQCVHFTNHQTVILHDKYFYDDIVYRMM